MASGLFTFASLNCRNVKRCVDGVKHLCKTCVVIALQETWLLPDEIPFLNGIDDNFCATGTSAVDTTVGMLRGRPHGGVALLWNSAVFHDVSVVQCDNPRLCAIKVVTDDRPIIVISVYMPTNSADNLTEFTDCLGAVSAIVDEYGIESVYIMGDFNAHPGELFFRELMNYCNDLDWCCMDTLKLGIDSGTYTFISDAHKCRRWLDHCVTTQSALSSVHDVYVNYNVTWSDHFPLMLQCNLKLLTPRLNRLIGVSNQNVIWGQRGSEQISRYKEECNSLLKCIDFPIELTHCADKYCSEISHRKVLDTLYKNIVSALCVAATRTASRKRKSKKQIVGWNRHVSDAHRAAREKFHEWTLCGRPEGGRLFNEMCKGRFFHFFLEQHPGRRSARRCAVALYYFPSSSTPLLLIFLLLTTSMPTTSKFTLNA
ncbi:uncharacterized protein LOC133524553 [Cydia pomonella]|uniref:uncharacterized protein LOC133524553 n=1 Tax=Cydia pomonella TaxID=82600 RepID=UPI002ADDA96A|nr:uncharacterized protein LOC133524553 [Cydia pomonella]